MTLEMKIDEEREQARAECERIGRELGEEWGKQLGNAIRIATSIDNLMISLHLTVESACKAIGIQPEEYEEAKKYFEK